MNNLPPPVSAPAPGNAAPKKTPKVIKRVEGVSVFPVARVQKIIKADPEVSNCSKEASFLIAQATEFFVKKFADQGYLKARTDSRKTIQLKDLADVVRTTPDFMFLEEMIPRPVPLNEALMMRAKKLVSDVVPTDMDDSDGPDGLEEDVQGEEQVASTAIGSHLFFVPNGSMVAKGKGRGSGVTRARKSLKRGEGAAGLPVPKKTRKSAANAEATEDALAAEDDHEPVEEAWDMEVEPAA